MELNSKLYNEHSSFVQDYQDLVPTTVLPNPTWCVPLNFFNEIVEKKYSSPAHYIVRAFFPEDLEDQINTEVFRFENYEDFEATYNAFAHNLRDSMLHCFYGTYMPGFEFVAKHGLTSRSFTALTLPVVQTAETCFDAAYGAELQANVNEHKDLQLVDPKDVNDSHPVDMHEFCMEIAELPTKQVVERVCSSADNPEMMNVYKLEYTADLKKQLEALHTLLKQQLDKYNPDKNTVEFDQQSAESIFFTLQDMLGLEFKHEQVSAPASESI